MGRKESNQTNTKRGGSCHPFWCLLTLVSLLKQLDANIYPVINAKTFLPVIDVALLMINAAVQNIAFKEAERLHQNRWQFGCQRNWSNVTLSFYSEGN